jgi:1-acyl-sn-glycerol-3-phosphate acyltransferase
VTSAPEHSTVPLIAAVGYALTAVIIFLALPIQVVLFALAFPFDRNRAVAGRFSRLAAVAVTRTFPPWRLRVEGSWPPGRRAYVVVANHQSLLDILLCELPAR